MPASRLVRAALAIAAASLLLAGTSSLAADRPGANKSRALDAAPWVTDGFSTPGTRALTGRSEFSAAPLQHGETSQHLPAVRENVELISKLEMNTPTEFRFDPATGLPDPSEPDVVAGQIADLAVYKNAAYLASWSEPSCKRGGFFSVDISNPAAPRQLAFVPALPETYHGEGAHVVTFNGRDILAVNNEPCGLAGVGGFDLYDVTNPASPVTLVQGAGDQSPDTPATGLGDTTQDPTAVPNSNHSIFLWEDRDRLYAVTVDNTELHDVDIFDVTDPRQPEFIADVDLFTLAEERGFDLVDNSANGNAIFHHDMVVKKIGNVQTMLVSYWDAGYVKLNVNDPSNPQFIGDSDFGTTDPLTGLQPPEGNAHQAEFSHDNSYVLAADEDFSTYRTDFEITTGPNAGPYPSGEFGFTRPIATLPDQRLNGPTIYGGYGCDADDQIPPVTALPALEENEEAIVVVQRGPVGDPSAPYDACRFDEKIQNAADKGYEGVIIANHHAGSGNGAAPDAAFCGGGDPRDISAMCIGHRAMHLLFNDPPDYDPDYTPNTEPLVGTVGEDVAATAIFDGWGYTHLYRNVAGGNLEEIDAFAIEEALDERYASGFGDLSVHEFAADASENVAYSSYYAGGMRVFTFGESGLTQTGKFIDEGGSNFWGVEQFTLADERYFAGSDRDFGLYILKYTGPGAAVRPVCTDSITMVPFRSTAPVQLPCADANGNALTRSVTSAPTRGTLGGDANSGAVTYTHTGESVDDTDSFTFVANDGTMSSQPATARIAVVPGDGGPCFNQYAGTAARDAITGSTFGDLIRGGGGRDFIDGNSGDDCLFGQGGEDQLEGGTDDDNLRGGAKEDRVFGGSGRDTLRGGKGADHMRGSSGNDRMFGDAGRDIMDGGSNRDLMRGGKGRDRLRGGPGRDRLFGGGKRDRLEVGDGNRNLASGGRGNDRIFAVNGKRDTIRCGPGRDRVQADQIDRVAGDCERVRRLEPRD